MRRRTSLAVPTIFLLTGMLLALAASSALAAGVSVTSQLSWSADVEPGGQAEGNIQLRNTGDKPGEVRIYQTDYLFRADGSNNFGDPGSVKRSNAAWVTVNPHQLVVAPGETAMVYFSVAVPRDPALTGTYWSMIMVEPIAPPAPPVEKGKPQIAVRTIVRYAIQVVANIGVTGKRDLRFVDRKLVVEGTSRFLQLDLENTGEHSLCPTVWCELYDKAGASAGRFEGRRQRLFPGCSGRFRIDLTKVPAGAYTAVVVADNADEYVFGARYVLDLADITAQAPAPVSAPVPAK